jgi:hypothetical protein
MVEELFNWLPAASQATADDALNTSRPSGIVARPRRPGRADYLFPPASPQVMVVDAAVEGSPAQLLLDGDDEDEDGEGEGEGEWEGEGLVLDGRDSGVAVQAGLGGLGGRAGRRQ